MRAGVVTPNPGLNGGAPGLFAIHFDTTSTFNFQNYKYDRVNTDGTGITPSTDTLQTNGPAIVCTDRAGRAERYAEPVQP